MSNQRTNILFAALLIGLLLLDRNYHVSFFIYGIVILLYLSVNLWGTLNVSSQFFIPARFKGDKHSGAIAITFDDGPVPDRTTRVLEILKAANVKATFFCIGKNVSQHAELAKRIHAEGHILGNHSYLHGPLFDLQSANSMARELLNTNDAIRKAAGVEPRFFRPPYGVTNPMLAKAVRQLRQVTIGWSVRSFDTVAKEKNNLLGRITRNLKAGDIILLHDRCEITVEILPDLLKRIADSGLKVDSLDKLIGERPYV